MTYQETVNYLFTLYPNLAKNGWDAYKPGLERVLELAKKTDNPHLKYPIIHIAGTNGKGSVSNILTSILMEAGFKVGLFTSPHLIDFSERIRVNGEPIAQQYVIDFVAKYDEVYKNTQPSFFEFTNMMAFKYFEDCKVDIAIIETGLGGRLDSTNICKPILSVITNIGMDHQKFLGNTIPKIASEKAGIIKSNTPVVIGETQVETTPVFIESAKNNNAPIAWADQQDKVCFKTDLLGMYQTKNIQTSYYAIQELIKQGWEIPIESIKNGVSRVYANTNFAGRWQQIRTSPKVIIDTGHNVEGIKMILSQLKDEKTNITMILAFASDKDISEIFTLLPKTYRYVFTTVPNARMLSSDELLQKANEQNLSATELNSIEKAYSFALNNSTKKDVIFVGGSNYLIGEFLKIIE